ncbi:MAG: RHS repeat-associated core domain-containing protein, partial [Phycisphaerales bacterium]
GACTGQPPQPNDYQRLYVREFRYEYDEPRAKYLVAERDCDSSSTVLARTWTDYVGSSVYGDYEVTQSGGGIPVYTELVSFLPGIGSITLGNVTTVKYDHSDHLGTLRALSDSAGHDGDAVVYTAFGERIDGPNHRYGYVGAAGYRAHEDFACDEQADPYAFPYLHVGFRYYDPASGRFLPRDPIGIGGGFNVYVYVMNRPTRGADPLGLDPPIVWGEEMPDPDAGGSVEGKREEYYRKRMRQFGWGGCSLVDFLAPWNIWKFVEDTYQAHAEAMEFYPDPPPPRRPPAQPTQPVQPVQPARPAQPPRKLPPPFWFKREPGWM